MTNYNKIKDALENMSSGVLLSFSHDNKLTAIVHGDINDQDIVFAVEYVKYLVLRGALEQAPEKEIPDYWGQGQKMN